MQQKNTTTQSRQYQEAIGWKQNKNRNKNKKTNLLIQSFLHGGITGNIPVKYL